MTISTVVSENTEEDLESLAKSGFYPNQDTNRMEQRTKCIVIHPSAIPPDSDVVYVGKNNGYTAEDGGGTLVLFLGHASLDVVDEGENVPILAEIR